MDKILWTFLGPFPIHTGPTPPLTPQTTLDACIQNFFSKFQLCTGWGKEELQENFERVHCLMREIKLCNEKLWLSTTPVSGQPRPQRHFRTVVDSNRSVSLPFDIRKILCTYPRKKKDIRGLQMFQIGDLSPGSWLGGWLASGARIRLFHGREEDQTRRPDPIKHVDEQFCFN